MKIGGKYRIFETLGCGSFGKTHKVTNFRDEFALKEIVVVPQLNETIINSEIEAHENLPRHNNVVTFIDHFTENNTIYIVLDFYDSGNLNDFACRDVMDEVAIVRAVRDVAHGLRHLHKHGVVHGNIKPQNVVYELTHGNKPVFKISDVNLTKAFYTPQQFRDAFESDPKSALFWAPEYADAKIEFPGDIFSLAIVVLALFLRRIEGKLLWPVVKSSNNILALCNNDEIETIVKLTVPGNLQEISMRMLAINPSNRPVCDEVVSSLD